MLQNRIVAERARDDAGRSGSLLKLLARALDDRRWHRFRVQRWQDGQWRPVAGPASSGGRALGLTVPLFGAVFSFYTHGGSRHTPRLVLLDEASAGIDDAARAHCMALVRGFDLDFVMTSEPEWACYVELPSVSICQLQRQEGIDAVYVSRWSWDGRARASRKTARGALPRRLAPQLPNERCGSETGASARRRCAGPPCGTAARSVSARPQWWHRHARSSGRGSARCPGQPAGAAPSDAGSLRFDIAELGARLRDAGLATSLRHALELFDGPLVDFAAASAEMARNWEGARALATDSRQADFLSDGRDLGLLKRRAVHVPVAQQLMGQLQAVLAQLPATAVTRSHLAAQLLGERTHSIPAVR